jgi:2-methylisocitrate lyase-like PEP mutase family enzyme
VQQAISRTRRRQSARRRDLVQLFVQSREKRRVTRQRPEAPAQLGEHRRSLDPLQDERIRSHIQHARHGEAAIARVAHDERLSLSVAATSEAPEHTTVSEIEDLGGSPGRDELHADSVPRGKVVALSTEQSDQKARGEAFRALHEGEAFVIPNPWDAGSARVLAALGFKALATTSSGFAFTLGRRDGEVTLDEVVEHVAVLSAATELPISVDLENGYSPDADDAALAVRYVAEAGAVGGSIEDYDPQGHLYERDHAVERVAAAVEAARGLDFPFTLTARAENHIRGNPNLEDTIERLQAYEQAGADVLYAPGLRSADEISAVCSAVAKPVNVLALPTLSLAEIVEAGARRVSVGGALTWVAARALADAAVAIRDDGDLAPLAARVSLDEWFAE